MQLYRMSMFNKVLKFILLRLSGPNLFQHDKVHENMAWQWLWNSSVLHRALTLTQLNFWDEQNPGCT